MAEQATMRARGPDDIEKIGIFWPSALIAVKTITFGKVVSMPHRNWALD
jgi:hypothetical protein